jgi:hypothetical protein
MAYDVGIEVDLCLEGMHVLLYHTRAIQLFVIRAVRAYLLAKGDMKVESKCVDILELVRKRLARASPFGEENLALTGQGSEEELSNQVFHGLNHSTRVCLTLTGRVCSR